MEESKLAAEIAAKVVADTNFWIALVGFAGVVVGSIITIAGNFLLHWFKEAPHRELDKSRMSILEEMLDDGRFPEKWRKITTLSAVIGASEEETKRILIKVKARGSETADGKWGLIRNHPFPGGE